ncbi:MAG: hypothetical protein PHU81_04995 [Acidobacteriota bacterium]|nr:hypothetical protein [Acidobacteriota bacterium]
MKKKVQVIISQIRLERNTEKKLPVLLSPEARLNHLISTSFKLQPEKVTVISRPFQLYSPVRKTDRLIIVQPEEALAGSHQAGSLSRLRLEGDVLLLSTEFFPFSEAVWLRALEAHQKSDYRLTFLAGKQRAENTQAHQDYFVYPGLAVISLKGERRNFEALKFFKPSGELDVVGLTDYLEPDFKGLGFDWVTDKDQRDFLIISKSEDWSQAASILRQIKVAKLEETGTFFLSPDESWIDPQVQTGRGTVIYPSVIIEGQTRLGKDCVIYPHCHIIDSQIGDRVKVFGSTVVEGCRIENDAQIGPFSRLRQETKIKAGSRVGNFVEMKKTAFGPESKAMHLSYLGDAMVGAKVNIGAGTITCNYDGEKKNKTIIGPETFVGSGTELVAPVRVGRGAYIAAGSTITDNVLPGSLAIARSRQVEKKGWARRRKELIELRKKRK